MGSRCRGARSSFLALVLALLRPHLLANHFPALHGLRVLAILTIVQLHVTVGFRRWGIMPDQAFYDRSTTIWFGMDLFFLLSGFLIGAMLLRDGVSAAGAGRFWARRSFRIIPLYYVVLTFMTLAPGTSPGQRADVWHEFLYLTNYFPLRRDPVMIWAWSLCVEEHFYLAVPLLLAALSRVRAPAARLGALGALWASGVALRLGAVLLGGAWSFDRLFVEVYPRTHLRYDILVAGVILAELQHHHKDRIDALLQRPWVNALSWAVPLASLGVLLWPPSFVPMPLRWALLWGGVTAVMYVPLVLQLVNRPSWLARALGHRAWLWVATFGYGIYLVHIPVANGLVYVIGGIALQLALHGTVLPLTLVWALAVAVTFGTSLAIAYALHLAVEKPMLALRDRLVPGRG